MAKEELMREKIDYDVQQDAWADEYEEWKSMNRHDLSDDFIDANNEEYKDWCDMQDLGEQFIEEHQDAFEDFCIEEFKNRKA